MLPGRRVLPLGQGQLHLLLGLADELSEAGPPAGLGAPVEGRYQEDDHQGDGDGQAHQEGAPPLGRQRNAERPFLAGAGGGRRPPRLGQQALQEGAHTPQDGGRQGRHPVLEAGQIEVRKAGEGKGKEWSPLVLPFLRLPLGDDLDGHGREVTSQLLQSGQGPLRPLAEGRGEVLVGQRAPRQEDKVAGLHVMVEEAHRDFPGASQGGRVALGQTDQLPPVDHAGEGRARLGDVDLVPPKHGADRRAVSLLAGAGAEVLAEQTQVGRPQAGPEPGGDAA